MGNMQYWRSYIVKHAVLEVILGNMQYWRSYWETCSTGGLSEEHAVLEVIVRNMQYWRS